MQATVKVVGIRPFICKRASFSTQARMFDKIIIANRGEIACRIIRTARKMGVKTVAVYSDADAHGQFVKLADEAHRIGPPPTTESYLVKEKILEAAMRSGAQALHPGYGFLSENPDFADMCRAAGVEFIGPPGSALRSMGSKASAKEIMTKAGVPVTPAYYGVNQEDGHLLQEAEKIGFPVMIKAVVGGGGKGMRRVLSKEEFLPSLEACRREALKSFGKDRVLIEKYLVDPRHIELQVFGDSHGNAVHLYERDCSVQRRHQKVLEESPAPGLSESLRQEMGHAAVLAAKAVGYVGAGTVEFLLDPHTNGFYFCEMNTRLQVEHPVTEMVTGVDLVEWQLRVAAGEPLPIIDQFQITSKGHAIEARVYAENPAKGFLPATGTLKWLRTPEPLDGRVRVETGVIQGDDVSMYYDPMIAKLLTWAPTRSAALRQLSVCLKDYQIGGLPNNLEFLQRCVEHPAFERGGVTTGFLVEHEAEVSIPPPKPPTPHLLTIAAFSLLHQREGAAGGGGGSSPSPWTSSGAWRAFGERTVPLNFMYEGMTTATTTTTGSKGGGGAGMPMATVHRDGSFTVHVDKATSILVYGTVDAAGNTEATVDGVKYQYAAWVVDRGETQGAELQIWLKSGGLVDDPAKRHTFKLEVPRRVFGGGEGIGGPPRVVSPMPGKVVKVLIQSGDVVKKGQALVILEAMKMEHVIAAPTDAVVESVLKSVGDIVQDGVALVTLKAAAASPPPPVAAAEAVAS